MVRIYTRAGDGGETSLGNGSRVRKSDPRVAVYGAVDELNSLMGACAAVLRRPASPATDTSRLAELAIDLERIQRELFALGTVLADPDLCAAREASQSAETEFPAERLEKAIDRLDLDLPELRNFILPGGHEAACLLHVARTASRSAERKAVALAAEVQVPPSALVYLNRLSDYLFTAARWVNTAAGSGDVPWRPADPGSPTT